MGGNGSELRRPLGIAIVGGLMVSQMLTLYTTPVVYLYLDRFRAWVSGREKIRPLQDAVAHPQPSPPPTRPAATRLKVWLPNRRQCEIGPLSARRLVSPVNQLSFRQDQPASPMLLSVTWAPKTTDRSSRDEDTGIGFRKRLRPWRSVSSRWRHRHSPGMTKGTWP